MIKTCFKTINGVLIAATNAFERLKIRVYSFKLDIFISKNKFLKNVIITIFILKTLDWVTSIIAFQKFGLAEGNPLAAKIFETYGIWLTLFLGYIVTFIYVIVLEWLKSSIPLKVYWFMYALILCMYTIAVINNIVAIYYYY